jgi:hypothetical protein
MRGAIAFLATVLAVAPATALPKSFDGDWTVDVRTTVGDCQSEIAGTVHVQDGRVIASSADGVDVWGYVEDDGVVSARFTQGQDILRANGKMKGAAGSGAWSSNTRYCGGKWSARRVG